MFEPEFRGSTGWGTRLYMAGWGQWGLAMQDDLDDGMDFLVKQGVVDAKRVCIMGASYGGCAVMGPMKAPVLMVYGGQDRRVPLVFGEKMRNALQAQGTPVEWVVYSEEGHGFLFEKNRYDFYGRVAKFLGDQLGPN